MTESDRMIVETSSWMWAAVGGALIGLASLMLLHFNGRIAGISGIADGIFASRGEDARWRLAFVGGLLVGGIVLLGAYPEAFPSAGAGRSLGAVAAAGVLVGFGTRMGSGCTSGHGVCGMSRLSPRSFAATAAFMVAGALSVGVVRHVLGGAL